VLLPGMTSASANPSASTWSAGGNKLWQDRTRWRAGVPFLRNAQPIAERAAAARSCAVACASVSPTWTPSQSLNEPSTTPSSAVRPASARRAAAGARDLPAPLPARRTLVHLGGSQTRPGLVRLYPDAPALRSQVQITPARRRSCSAWTLWSTSRMVRPWFNGPAGWPTCFRPPAAWRSR
jgi:hypothetical protein